MPRATLGVWTSRLLAVFLVASAVGGLVVAYGEPYYHWRVVAPGLVYRSGTLCREDLVEVVDRFGVRTLLNLRSEAERADGTWYEDERRVAAERGVRLVDVPLPEGTPPTPAQVEQILGIFDAAAEAPVLFHCEHGVVRSAAVEGLYRREYLREGPEEALSRVAVFGRDLDRKYPAIARFIREYVPRSPARTPPRTGPER
jgi:protein tyrosine phosphatase (PTP) superfamily phosphohydrolase (DUF442 family)